jgi:hypothetical protein
MGNRDDLYIGTQVSWRRKSRKKMRFPVPEKIKNYLFFFGLIDWLGEYRQGKMKKGHPAGRPS